MIQFPSTARVGRVMPKEVFYKQLNLSRELKEKFVSDIQRITMEYALTAESIHVDKSDDLLEILVLGILLKKQDFDGKILETIAKQNKHTTDIYSAKNYEENIEKLDAIAPIYYENLHDQPNFAYLNWLVGHEKKALNFKQFGENYLVGCLSMLDAAFNRSCSDMLENETRVDRSTHLGILHSLQSMIKALFSWISSTRRTVLPVVKRSFLCIDH